MHCNLILRIGTEYSYNLWFKYINYLPHDSATHVTCDGILDISGLLEIAAKIAANQLNRTMCFIALNVDHVRRFFSFAESIRGSSAFAQPEVQTRKLLYF